MNNNNENEIKNNFTPQNTVSNSESPLGFDSFNNANRESQMSAVPNVETPVEAAPMNSINIGSSIGAVPNTETLVEAAPMNSINMGPPMDAVSNTETPVEAVSMNSINMGPPMDAVSNTETPVEVNPINGTNEEPLMGVLPNVGLPAGNNSIPSYGLNNNQKPTTTKNNSNKTVFIVIILFVLLGVGAFFVFKGFGGNKLEANLDAVFDPDKPIVVLKNKKYGYITSEGKTIIEPKYISASDFYGDYAVVTVENSKSDSYYQKNYQVIDKKGNVKLTSEGYTAPKYYQLYDLWIIDGALYDSNLTRKTEEGIMVGYISDGYFKYSNSAKKESGILNYKGKKVFSVPETSIYVDISRNEYNEDDLYAVVTTYGDSEKEVIVSLKTGDILFTSEDAKSYYISEEEFGLFYYYNQKATDGYSNRKYLFFIDNKLAYESSEKVYDVQVYDYKNKILQIDYGYWYEDLGKASRYNYYDVKNKKFLTTLPNNSSSADDLEIDLINKNYGFKEFSSSGRYGIMSGEKVLVPCEYDSIRYMNLELFNYMKSKGKKFVFLIKDKKIILYDLKKSKSIAIFDSTYFNQYSDSTFIKFDLYKEDGYTKKGYVIYNVLSGKTMTFGIEDSINIGSNYIKVKQSDKAIYYNTDLEKIYEANES